MEDLNRRKFLVQTAGAAAITAAPAFLKSTYGSPNDRIRVAVVGLHGQGGSHVSSILRLAKENVELAALCDVDERELTKRVAAGGALDKAGIKPKTYYDIRKLLEDKEIDAISVAVPNHWHALATVWGCQAGKDVYIEKPASHDLWEGRKMVEAARKYKRIVQVGTQSRSSVALQEGVQQMRDGLLGEVYMARGLCFKWRDTIGKKEDEAAAPAGVHYDIWLGPARVRPFNANRFHYNWHWNWEYGNGDIGNQGIHEMDIARWGLGVKLPVRATSMGGHYMFDDDQVTPNTQVSALEFDENGKKKLLVFEVRHWMTNHEAGIGEGRGKPEATNTIGNTFFGSKGYMAIDGYNGYKTWLGRAAEPGPTKNGGGDHHANFFAAMRSRKVEDLNADVEEGHLSAVCVHLANISYRVGRTINFDPKTEKIVGDAEASKLMKREYRKGFEIPEKV
jgi:predicted dehydrogenase